MAFIGIDLGTSFIKAGLLAPDALRLSHVRRVPFPAPLPGLPPLHHEYDPGQVLAAVRRLLGEMLPEATPCEGIVMCSQMHGMVLTTEDGVPCSNLTTWQDQRALEPHPSGDSSYFDVMMQRLSRDDLRRIGHEYRAGHPVSVLFWLAEQGRLPGPDVIPTSLPDFVLAVLCETAPSTEATNAHACGALDIETLDWHRPLLQKLGLERLRWPIVRPHGEAVGTLHAADRAIPCYTPVGDYQAALAGALLREGELSLNLSTGGQASLLKPRPEAGDYQTRPFFDGRYLATITNIPAGRSLDALVRLLTELPAAQGIAIEDPWDDILGRAAAVGDPRLSVDLAIFDSSCGDRGAIRDIREEELTVGHLFRAAFRNLADNCYAAALRLSPERAWQGLVFSGGLLQKIDLLRELIVARFGVDWRLCPTQEDTLLGLLALALAFSGRASSVAAAQEMLWPPSH